MRASYALVAIVLTTANVNAVNAQGPARKSGPVKFWAVSDLSFDPTEPALIKARPADPLEYPATFYTAQRLGRCTSTVIGPRVLLTAAHCVEDGGAAELRAAGQNYRSTCTRAAEYPANITADWALCLIDRPIAISKYETVSIRPDLLLLNGELLLTGFGCIHPDGTGGNDGIYRIGESPIKGLPSGNNNDIRTKGGAALCFGDSGGPAFTFLDPEKKVRLQVSVNSRGNIKNESYLVSLAAPAAISFMRTWSAHNGVQICGVHAGIPNCRTVQ